MSTHTSLRVGALGRLSSIVVVGIALPVSCAPKPIDPSTEITAARAIGLDQPIIFQTEGGPLDEPSAPDSLSLTDAIQRSVGTDPGLQGALARVRIAMADADQSRLLPNPVLNFILRWGPGKPQFEISLTQDLIQTLRIPRQTSAADNRLRRAAADAVTVALDVVATVSERYITAQALESLIPVLAERRNLLDKLISTARARLEVKEGTKGDLVTLEAQGVELDVQIADSRRELEVERLRLARLIGVPTSAATWKLDAWISPTVKTISESSWIETALAHRTEVQAATWTLAALGDEAVLARFFPWEGARVGVDVQRDNDLFAGPSILTPLPIFDMGQARSARVAAAQMEARHDLTMAKRLVVEEVRVALRSFEASTENLRRIQSQLIPLQEQRRQQAENAYRAGVTDVTALFLAEQDLRAAQAKAIEIERQMSISLVDLERAVGGPGIASALTDAPLTPSAPGTSPAPSHVNSASASASVAGILP